MERNGKHGGRAELVYLALVLLLAGTGCSSIADLAAGAARYHLLTITAAERGAGNRDQLEGGSAAQSETTEPNPSKDTVYQLSVANTTIAYPVVKQRPEDPDGFYLSHDAWRRPCGAGSLYLDRDSGKDCVHQIVYGHRLIMTNMMFSPLSNAWEPKGFESLGAMTLRDAKTGSSRTLKPLCALKVHESFASIRRFEFNGKAEFASWLNKLCSHADVVSKGSETRLNHVERALTTVTCTGRLGGDMRCLVIWIEEDAAAATTENR